ncbi:hypothetical protein KUTeg_023471 [Tegillarca granosa]|uniref:EF-hand domain-containing protein n=1 Tax=Tegillarca granosa TaxID=220873 RepID=A0ABQ9E6N6_TEGGR|nr:hypothetical protein KUTeg_023471 [Tegillarca granosa]
MHLLLFIHRNPDSVFRFGILKRMKLSAFLLAIFLAMLLVDSINCWGRRRYRVRVRRIWNPICTIECSRVCTYPCRACIPVCRYVCKRVCRGKREESHELSANSFIKLMPCDFDIYDTNNDDVISIQELGQQNGETGNEEDVKQLFAVMDANNDGYVSRDEFEIAPLMKDCNKKNSSNNGNPKARSLEPELDDMEEDINDLE